MRVIFATTPVPASDRLPTGREVRGNARFIARVFEPGEEIPAGHHPWPVSDWLKSLAPGQPLRDSPPPSMRGASTAVVPRALLEGLHPETLLAIEWELRK